MAPKRESAALDGEQGEAVAFTGRPKKKLRTFTEEDVKLARIWEKLASDVQVERFKAAVDLVKHYISTSSTDESRTNDDNACNVPKGARKIEVRLLRGLCSGRKSARIGFSLALTEVLRITFGTSAASEQPLEQRIGHYLEDVRINTRPEAGASSQEKRDALLGQVFALSSLTHSGIILEKNNSRDALRPIVDFIFTSLQGAEWPWLAEEWGLVCCQLVRLVLTDKDSNEAAEDILNTLHARGLAKTREGIAIWLEVQSKCPDIKYPSKVWHKDDPLTKKETTTIAKVLHSIKLEAESKSVTGAREQRPHFAWMTVLNKLIQRDTKVSNDSVFKRFWLEAVDNTFFATTASAEKKAVGFQLFQQMIATAPASALPATFSPKLMKCLINQSAQQSRYLNATAKHVLDSMASRAKVDPGAAPIIFSSLISGNGDIDFDRLTKSKTTFQIFSNASDDVQTEMVRLCQDLLVSPPSEKQSTEAFQQKLADQLVAWMRLHKLEFSNLSSFVQEKSTEFHIMHFFLTMGFFQDASKHFSSKTQEMFRTRYIACLAHIAPKQSTNAVAFLRYAVREFLKHSPQEITTLDQATDKVITTIQSANDILKKSDKGLQQVAEDHDSTSLKMERRQQGFQILLGMTLLQAYNGDTEAITMLEELEACREDVLNADADTRGKACTAIIEIILSFSSQQSAMNRKLSEQAFGDLACDVNEDGLQALVDVLQQREGIAGQTALFGDNEGGNSDVEDENSEVGSDVEVDSDVEEIAGAEKDESSAEDESDDESDDDSSSSNDGSVSSELAEFESKLANALKVKNRPDVTNDAEDASTASSDESDMDDEQMLDLDSTISNMFKQRSAAVGAGGAGNSDGKSNSRQAHKAAKENVLAFKNRVLALLAIYLKQQHASALALSTILPLLELVRMTRNAQLGARASALLHDTYFPTAKKRGLPLSTPVDEIVQLLKDVIRETTQWVSREHVKCGSRSCLFLARVALATAETLGHDQKEKESEKKRREVAKKIGKVYKEARGDEDRPDWQETLWNDWEQFKRQVLGEKN